MTDKESILEHLRTALVAIKKQTALCMDLFQRWGHPHRETEDQLLVILRRWKAFVAEAESAGVNVRQELGERDWTFIRSQLELLKPPPPTRIPLSVYAFMENGFDSMARPAAKKSSTGDGLDWMLQ